MSERTIRFPRGFAYLYIGTQSRAAYQHLMDGCDPHTFADLDAIWFVAAQLRKNPDAAHRVLGGRELR
jgi:hypothetical protein